MSNYNRILQELLELIPKEEYERIMSQDMCEYDCDFLGFINVYKSLSELIPKGFVIIDFGCYLAAQSYFFSGHKQYIGVDTVDLKRFKPYNAVHYISSIQSFIREVVPKVLRENDKDGVFAICSYVPDREAVRLVRETFPNVFCYYPSGGPSPIIKLNGGGKRGKH